MNLQDLYDWIFHQRTDGAGLPMKTVGILLGLLLLASHLWAWRNADKAMAMAKAFPRHRIAGIALLTLCLLWSLFLVSCMDMGEFFTWRTRILMLLPVTFVLVILYVPEFLAVRALGSLMLLAAMPVLSAAFLQPQLSRLLLPVLAYAWIIGGMFFVGMPYLLRDGLQWVSQSRSRWKMATLGGAVYGTALLVAALVTY
ncbi:MAG: hypothetical protein RL693_2809 [Verrucomicrobiota bacterium]|jgi:uncharacterized membrane protein (DUF485 family)